MKFQGKILRTNLNLKVQKMAGRNKFKLSVIKMRLSKIEEQISTGFPLSLKVSRQFTNLNSTSIRVQSFSANFYPLQSSFTQDSDKKWNQLLLKIVKKNHKNLKNNYPMCTSRWKQELLWQHKKPRLNIHKNLIGLVLKIKQKWLDN